MKQEKDGDYFWDSYALAELMSGNPNYAKFKDKQVIITVFNLVEIYWIALREYDEKTAEEIYTEYSKCVSKIPDSILKEAVKFRYKNKKQDLSYADCIGYIYAKKNKLKFLTGDKEFKNLNNVEFVR